MFTGEVRPHRRAGVLPFLNLADSPRWGRTLSDTGCPPPLSAIVWVCEVVTLKCEVGGPLAKCKGDEGG